MFRIAVGDILSYTTVLVSQKPQPKIAESVVMAAKKYFVLRQGKKDTAHVFTGRQPRQAALKAATRGFVDIALRERGRRNKDGTYSVHMFKGSRKKVNSPSNAPGWMPKAIWKPVVKKVKVEHIKL